MAEILVERDDDLLISRVSNLLTKAAEDAIARDEIFKVGLSGDFYVLLADIN